MILNRNNFNNLEDVIEKQVLLDDSKLIPHLAKIINFIKSDSYSNQSLIQVSNIIKQTQPIKHQSTNQPSYTNIQISKSLDQQYPFEIKNFQIQGDKLQWAGISFGNTLKSIINQAIINIATQQKVQSIRFWGKINGTINDYYIVQAIKKPLLSHLQFQLGDEKTGEGINYYTFWVTNDPSGEWIELPNITRKQLQVSRLIKKHFTGNLNENVNSYPVFPGTQKHYLKAQLCRMTHSLELCPKGIYKPNDDNPKLIQYQEEVKIPQYAELNTLEGWCHKNTNILQLGRCTHFVDPNLPQDQIEAVTAELAQKDPQIERLRPITEDKPSEALIASLGVQNLWLLKQQGDNQVFSKDQSQLVYGVTVLRNINWAGWTVIGYKGGYSNIYVGNGLKRTQNGWSTYQNPPLSEQGQEIEQKYEPNPKQLPPPIIQEPKQEVPPQQ